MTDSKTRMWVALFVTVVFVCGLSIGLAVSAWLPPRPGLARLPARFPGGPPGGPGALVSERILDRLTEDPEFTEAQREQLLALFAERENRFRQFNREMRRRFESERARLRDDIAAILTPEQMEIFDSARRRPRRRNGER